MTPRSQVETRTAPSRAFELVGGRPCLDFVNTVAWRDTDAAEERLESFDELLAWCRSAGALAPSSLARLRRLRSGNRRELLERARGVRELLHRLLAAWRRSRAPRAEDLRALNELLAELPSRRSLTWSRRGFGWDAGALRGAPPATAMLEPVIQSAVELLVEGDRARVKKCDGGGCGWLFYDESRAGSRRWCSMSDCGNRAKARRHYRRRS